MDIYYDETNNSKKIGVNSKRMRYDEKIENFFMFAFLEISNENIKKISILEDNFKKKRGIPKETELKSKHICKLDITKMRPDQIQFMEEVLKILNNEGEVINIGCISKLNLFVMRVFSANYIKNIIGNYYEDFLYSITKYLSVRRAYETNDIISSDTKVKTIFSNIISWLEQDIKKTEIENEKKTFEKIIKTISYIKTLEKRIWKKDFLKWDYWTTVESLSRVLEEKKINEFNLIYDEFEELRNVWEKLARNNLKFRFTSKPSHSKDVLGIRVVDWYIGFLRKFAISLSKKTIENTKKFNTVFSVEESVLKFVNENKNLFVFFKQTIGKEYWSTFSSKYSDTFLVAMICIKLSRLESNVTKNKIDNEFINTIL